MEKSRKDLCKRIVHCPFKRTKNVACWRLNMYLRFLERLKKTKSFGRKIVLRKKGCTLEWSLALSQKYAKSFGGKNLALCKRF